MEWNHLSCTHGVWWALRLSNRHVQLLSILSWNTEAEPTWLLNTLKLCSRPRSSRGRLVCAHYCSMLTKETCCFVFTDLDSDWLSSYSANWVLDVPVLEFWMFWFLMEWQQVLQLKSVKVQLTAGSFMTKTFYSFQIQMPSFLDL